MMKFTFIKVLSQKLAHHMYPSAKTKEPMDIFESKLLTINFNVDKFGKKISLVSLGFNDK